MSPNFIKLVFLGDVAFSGHLSGASARSRAYICRLGERIKEYVKDADLVFFNLEGPLHKGTEERPGVTVHLANHPSILDFFRSKATYVANIANNHILDYGLEGLLNTTSILKKRGVYYVGAGRDSTQASKPVIFEVRGKRVGFLGFTSNASHVGAVIAAKDKAGCASLLQEGEMMQKVADTRSKVDVLGVSLHWGYEYFLYPSSDQISLAHRIADAGAHFIVGHHPHVPQGIERYRNCLIMYSLGNFLFSPVSSTSGRPVFQKEITKEFMVVTSKWYSEKSKTRFDILGGRSSDEQPLQPYTGENLKRFTDRMTELSSKLTAPDYQKFWFSYKKKRLRQLEKENLLDAFRKATMISPKELIKTVSIRDIRRNLLRLRSLLP